MTQLAKRHRATLAVLLALFLWGCTRGHGLAGTWTGTARLPGGGTTPLTMNLRPDGTFLSESEGRGYGGAYSVEENILSETTKLYVSNGQTHAIPSGAYHTERFGFKIDGDTLTLTPQDGSPPLSLSRQAQ